MLKTTFDIPGYPAKISVETYYKDDPSRAIEVFGLGQHEKLAKEYMKTHGNDINRRVDMLILYIDSFRKTFERNLSKFNREFVAYIQKQSPAVKSRESFLREYLYAIKNAYRAVRNGIVSIKNENIILVELDLNEYEGREEDIHHREEHDAIDNILYNTARELRPLGKVLGEGFVNAYGKSEKYQDDGKGNNSDKKNHYVIDIYHDDDIGYAELSAVTFFKLGE